MLWIRDGDIMRDLLFQRMERLVVRDFGNGFCAAGSALRLFQRRERLVDRANWHESCLLCVGIYSERDFSERAQTRQARLGFAHRIGRDHRGRDCVLRQSSLLSFPLVIHE